MKKDLLFGACLLTCASFGGGTAAAQCRIGELRVNDPSTYPEQSWRLAARGDVALVGQPLFDTLTAEDIGAVYVFERTPAGWVQVDRLLAPDGAAGHRFGYSIALDGNRALIGSVGDGLGSAYVFERDAAGWTMRAKLTQSGPVTQSGFGASVDLDGDAAVIAGVVRVVVFSRDAAGWSEEQLLEAWDGAGFASYPAVKLSGNHVLVRGSGLQVYVFARQGSHWVRDGLLRSQSLSHTGYFGTAFDVEGNIAIVGSPAELTPTPGSRDPETGAAWVFRREAAGWSPIARLLPSGLPDHAGFGQLVAIEGRRALIGSYEGFTDVYEREGSTWSERARLETPPTFPFTTLQNALAGSSAFVLSEGHFFEFQLTGCGDPTRFCTGSDTSCPCGNGGAPDAGCNNAQGSGGVRLFAASLALDTPGFPSTTLISDGYPYLQGALATYLRSPVPQAPGLPFGDGLLCLFPAGMVNLGTRLVAFGSTTLAYEHQAGPGTFYYQVHYSNRPTGFCNPGAAFNTSNGLSVTW